MSTFGLICTLVSITIFAVWLTICLKKFGLAPSYSAYNPMWDKAVPINNMHLWSIITFAIAATFMVGMILFFAGYPAILIGYYYASI